ncbi:MAG: hypothetical protein IT440_08080 [Phycisphaeraceae bacterium]|nr:hypothetical protein [Phycisphaeraceae bacterium]
MLKFQCTHCRQQVMVLAGPTGLGGKVKCPRCGAMVAPASNVALGTSEKADVHSRELLDQTLTEEQQAQARHQQEQAVAREQAEQQAWDRKLQQRREAREQADRAAKTHDPKSKSGALAAFLSLCALLLLAGGAWTWWRQPANPAAPADHAPGSALSSIADGPAIASHVETWVRQLHRQQHVDPGMIIALVRIEQAEAQGDSLVACRGRLVAANRKISAEDASALLDSSTSSQTTNDAIKDNVDLIRKAYDPKKIADAASPDQTHPASSRSGESSAMFNFNRSDATVSGTSEPFQRHVHAFLAVARRTDAASPIPASRVLDYFQWDPPASVPPLLSDAELTRVAELTRGLLTSWRDASPDVVRYVDLKPGESLFPPRFAPKNWQLLRADQPDAATRRAFVMIQTDTGTDAGTWLLTLRPAADQTWRVTASALAPAR